MRRSHHVLCIGFLLASVSLTSAQLLPNQSWEIPFRLYNRFAVVIGGTIGNVENCSLLIDTGTNPTIIDSHIVRKLHLSSSKAMMSVTSGEITSSQAVIPVLEVGPVIKHNLTTAVRDLTEISKKIGVHIDAVIGLDVLSETNLRISYERKMIVFNDLSPNDPNSAAFDKGASFVVVPMTMNQHVVHVLVDTGSFGLVLFRNRAGLKLDGIPGTSREYQSVGGDFDLSEVEVRNASLGNLYLGTRRALIGKGPTNVPFDGLLGVASLGVREVSFDFRRRQFAWQ
jgi:hypothetical protein